MSSEKLFTGLGAAALAAVGVYFHQLIFPGALLLTVMTTDYATGMIDAWVHSQFSSRTGMIGLVKKLCYFFGVAVAIVADFIIQIAGEQLGHDLSGCYFCGLLVIIWLTLNECISILENLDSIGVPMPPFLAKLIARLKSAAEKTGDGKAGGGEHDGT